MLRPCGKWRNPWHGEFASPAQRSGASPVRVIRHHPQGCGHSSIRRRERPCERRLASHSWGFRLAAEPKRWIGVTSPPSLCLSFSPDWSGGKRVITRCTAWSTASAAAVVRPAAGAAGSAATAPSDAPANEDARWGRRPMACARCSRDCASDGLKPALRRNRPHEAPTCVCLLSCSHHLVAAPLPSHARKRLGARPKSRPWPATVPGRP